MTAYVWPFPVNRFEMRILPNTRVFTGPYTPTTQTLDLLGERLMISMDIPSTNDSREGAAREAFFNRLKASANLITIGHQKLRRPQGTLRGAVPSTWTTGGSASGWITGGVASGWIGGAPVIAFAIAQLANTAVISTEAGYTLLAGDWIGFGGQLVQIMATTVADSSGLMPIEFQPRARTAIAAGAAVLWDGPTANFILKPGTPNVPTSWTPGMVDGATIELIEIF